MGLLDSAGADGVLIRGSSVTTPAKHFLVARLNRGNDSACTRSPLGGPPRRRIATLRKSIDVHVFARETFDLGREVLAVGDKLSSAFTRRSEHSST
jgi:hypothetical protein